MAKDRYNQLQSLRQQVAALESKLKKRNRKLLQLPSKFGFKSMESFIEALRETSRSGGAKSGRSGSKPARRRAKITPETKTKVKELVKLKKSGTEIAKALGISLPSVQNIKKELGLVKKRRK